MERREASAPGLDWGALVDHWVEEHGSLAELALRLSLAEGIDADRESVERALRRLRLRGRRDGGEYGQRLLRAFGVPRDVEARVKWMGVYHSRFTDLPVSLCIDQLRVWNRPPVSESRARVWIELGLATAAVRAGDRERARIHLGQAELAPSGAAARVEQRLLGAFLDRQRATALLDEAEGMLADPELSRDERTCLLARSLDQRAYQVLHSKAPDFERARRLYEAIPRGDVPPFVLAKRESGLAYVCFRTGDSAAARAHAEAASRHAGDGGFVRLRLSYLGLLAHIVGEGEGADAIRERAVRAARLIEDEEIVARLTRT
ncbi:MAG: hypothetical protein ACXVEE_27630 [Polyangiales bacterium]